MEKYKNTRVVIDGIKFQSKKEMKRFITLKEMEERKEITDLQLQVRFELQPTFKLGNETIRGITYIADFTYYQNDEYIVEDVKASKNYKTEVYKLKKKLFEYKYKIKIRETY